MKNFVALIASIFAAASVMVAVAPSQPVAPPQAAGRVVTATSAYTAQPGDTVVCDPTGGAFTVTLPPTGNGVNRGRGVLVVNASGSANAVTVAAQGGGVTVDGLSSVAVQGARASRWVVSDGSNWASCSTGQAPVLIPFTSLQASPVDAQTVYVGLSARAPSASKNQSFVYMPRDGVITGAFLNVYAAGTAGSNEAWSAYIRYNDTSDTLIETVSASTAQRDFNNSGLSLAVQAGLPIELKFVNPTWGTNPTSVQISGWVMLQ